MATQQFFQRVFVVASLALLFAGCSRSGSGLLLDGAHLIEEGTPEDALVKLEAARESLGGEPRLWNHLGLAYQHLGRSKEALQSYQKALDLDLNLAEARYNLGWLYAEQENHPAALNEFITFVKLRPNSAEGWTRLGIQQVRVKRYDDAEQSLNYALRLQPKNPAANNALGLVHAARRRTREAGAQFNEALKQDPDYAPAKLNLGVMALQTGDRTAALNHLRAGLASSSNGVGSVQMAKLVSDLERQLTSEVRPEAPPTKAMAPVPQTTAPAIVAPPPETPVKPVVAAPAATTNKPAITAPAKTPTTAGPKAEPPAAKAQPAQRMEVVRVAEPPAIKPAGEVRVPASSAPATTAKASSSIATGSGSASMGTQPKEEDRPGFWARANPVRWFGGGKDEAASGAKPSEASKPITSSEKKTTPAAPQTARASAEPPSAAPISRYPYTRPKAPTPGNRTVSSRYLAAGLTSHRAGNLTAATTEYLTAITADPTHFEAHYNLGLAAFQAGNFKRSLSAYEQALSIKPTDADARYNFALALDKAGYPLDATNELQRLLDADDQNIKAHLTLGNLYANQLGETSKARKHYRKVLELDSKHSEAVAIRYWLAANPGN